MNPVTHLLSDLGQTLVVAMIVGFSLRFVFRKVRTLTDGMRGDSNEIGEIGGSGASGGNAGTGGSCAACGSCGGCGTQFDVKNSAVQQIGNYAAVRMDSQLASGGKNKLHR